LLVELVLQQRDRLRRFVDEAAGLIDVLVLTVYIIREVNVKDIFLLA
jgi:hypothetical protein